LQSTGQFFTYYCSFSGRHALSCDANLESLPKNIIDSSTILDRQTHRVKLFVTSVTTKVTERENIKLYFMNIGRLPVCYTTCPNGQTLYILKDAVSLIETPLASQTADTLGILIPPCISQITNNSAQILIEFEEVLGISDLHGLLSVTADKVIYAKKAETSAKELYEEVVTTFQHILRKKRSCLKMISGFTHSQKLLLVSDVKADYIYHQLHKKINCL
jgi:hypothetical protein